jgi:hypothetical protein
MRVYAMILAAFLSATVAAQTSSRSQAASAPPGISAPQVLEFGAGPNDFVSDEYALERRSLREIPASWDQEERAQPHQAAQGAPLPPKRDYLTEDQHLTAFKQPDEDAIMRASSVPANTKTANPPEPTRAANPAKNLLDAQKLDAQKRDLSAGNALERKQQPFVASGALPEGSSYLPAVAAVGLLGLVVGLLMRKKTT